MFLKFPLIRKIPRYQLTPKFLKLLKIQSFPMIRKFLLIPMIHFDRTIRTNLLILKILRYLKIRQFPIFLKILMIQTDPKILMYHYFLEDLFVHLHRKNQKFLKAQMTQMIHFDRKIQMNPISPRFRMILLILRFPQFLMIHQQVL
jgi:hypothetical protein